MLKQLWPEVEVEAGGAPKLVGSDAERREGHHNADATATRCSRNWAGGTLRHDRQPIDLGTALTCAHQHCNNWSHRRHCCCHGRLSERGQLEVRVKAGAGLELIRSETDTDPSTTGLSAEGSTQ